MFLLGTVHGVVFWRNGHGIIGVPVEEERKDLCNDPQLCRKEGGPRTSVVPADGGRRLYKSAHQWYSSTVL